MFHNQKMNNHKNRIHKRPEFFFFFFQDHDSTRYGSFKIHDRNLLESLIEIFKVKMNHLVPETMNKVSDIVE